MPTPASHALRLMNQKPATANTRVSGSLWACAQIDQIMMGFSTVNSTARV